MQPFESLDEAQHLFHNLVAFGADCVKGFLFGVRLGRPAGNGAKVCACAKHVAMGTKRCAYVIIHSAPAYGSARDGRQHRR
jgi:hypothetical protein